MRNTPKLTISLVVTKRCQPTVLQRSSFSSITLMQRKYSTELLSSEDHHRQSGDTPLKVVLPFRRSHSRGKKNFPQLHPEGVSAIPPSPIVLSRGHFSTELYCGRRAAERGTILKTPFLKQIYLPTMGHLCPHNPGAMVTRSRPNNFSE